MPMIHNARVQLIATALNNLALVFIVAGFVAPFVSRQLLDVGRVSLTFAWICVGILVHMVAQLALGRLKQ